MISQTIPALLIITGGVCAIVFRRPWARKAANFLPEWFHGGWPYGPASEKIHRFGYLVVGIIFVVFGLLALFRVFTFPNFS